jgi:hypothetical protein
MKREALTKPFRHDQIRERPGQNGKPVRYVDVTAVIERLNEACDAWSFEVLNHEVKDGEVIVLGKLTADGVVKTAFGGSAVTVDRQGVVVSIADDLKAASSDALKKSASMLGVGLELYGGSSRPDREASPKDGAADARRVEPRREPPDRVTVRQIAALQAACNRRGIPQIELLTVVERRTGKRELAQLSRTEASALITELSANGASH